MIDITDQLRRRLATLIEQAERDRAELGSPPNDSGQVLYARLIDSLTSALHNLEPAVEKSAK